MKTKTKIDLELIGPGLFFLGAIVTSILLLLELCSLLTCLMIIVSISVVSFIIMLMVNLKKDKAYRMLLQESIDQQADFIVALERLKIEIERLEKIESQNQLIEIDRRISSLLKQIEEIEKTDDLKASASTQKGCQETDIFPL